MTRKRPEILDTECLDHSLADILVKHEPEYEEEDDEEEQSNGEEDDDEDEGYSE
jgi:hypothetical protein